MDDLKGIANVEEEYQEVEVNRGMSMIRQMVKEADIWAKVE